MLKIQASNFTSPGGNVMSQDNISQNIYGNFYRPIIKMTVYDATEHNNLVKLNSDQKSNAEKIEIRLMEQTITVGPDPWKLLATHLGSDDWRKVIKITKNPSSQNVEIDLNTIDDNDIKEEYDVDDDGVAIPYISITFTPPDLDDTEPLPSYSEEYKIEVVENKSYLKILPDDQAYNGVKNSGNLNGPPLDHFTWVRDITAPVINNITFSWGNVLNKSEADDDNGDTITVETSGLENDQMMCS